MKRRSKISGEPIVRRRSKTPKAPRRNAPKVKKQSEPSPVAEEKEVARLASKLDEALDQLTSMSEVLGVISRSQFELQPLLQSVAFNAARLCRADGAAIFRLDGRLYHFEAGYSLNPTELEIERLNPFSAGLGTVVGRAAMTRQVAQIDDAGEPIGVIGLARRRVDPFTKREIELVTNFANQAIIAIENTRLLNELQQRWRCAGPLTPAEHSV
jgi:hypothetical protein